MRLRLLCSGLVWIAFAACSDDGLPQDSGTDGTTSGGTATSPSTTASTSPSTTMGDTLTGANTEGPGTTTDDDTTGPAGSDSTFGPSDTGETEPGTGTSTGSGSGSGSDTGSDTGTTTTGETTTGETDGTTTDGMTTGGPDPGEIGADCMDDMDCNSGVCWDYSDYDPMCGGAVCSISCMGDDECVAAFEEAGATMPDNVYCGDDNRCWALGSGFGLFFCF